MADDKIKIQEQLNKLAETLKNIQQESFNLEEKTLKVLNDIENKKIQQRAIQDEINTRRQRALELEEDTLSVFEEGLIKQNKSLQIAKDKKDSLDEIFRLNKDNLDIISKELRQTKKLIENGKQTKELNAAELQILKEKQEELAGERKTLILRLNTLRQERILAKKSVGDETKKAASMKIANAHASKFANTLGLASNVNKTWLGRLKQSVKATGGIGASISAYKSAFKDVISPANIFASLVSKIAQSSIGTAFAADQVQASFNQASGAGGRFNRQITDLSLNNLDLGIGFGDSAGAISALHSQMSLFTQTGLGAQRSASHTTALLSKLGVSAEATAGAYEVLTKVIGLSVKDSTRIIRNFGDISGEIGVPPARLINDFVATAPRLAAHGPRMTRIFKELARQAKATGVEMGSLVNIAGQFDTFEGSARAAGKLNAILGGNLFNSIELLNASESERIEILREGLKQSGKSFDSMNRFEKIALANAAGITNMAEASKLFGVQIPLFGKAAKEQKTLEERARASSDIMNKFQDVMKAFAVATTRIITLTRDLLDTFLGWNKEFPKLIPTITIITGAISGLLGIGSVIAAVKVAAVVITAAFAGISLPILGVVAAVTSAIAAVVALIAYKDEIIAFGKSFEFELPKFLQFVGNGSRSTSIEEVTPLASGTNNFSGGLALVGEKGPELVALPVGTNVISNTNSERLVPGITSMANGGVVSPNVNVGSPNVNVNAGRQVAAPSMPQQSSQGGDSGMREIVLKVNDREFARQVVNIFDDKMKLNTIGNN